MLPLVIINKILILTKNVQVYNLRVTTLQLLKNGFVLTHYLNKSKCYSFQINFGVKIKFISCLKYIR